MALRETLTERKGAVLRRWLDLIVDTYPDETAKFLKSQKDPFANPVGQTIRRGIQAILDGLLSGDQSSDVSPFLDDIVRVRAVQDLSPSQAVGFVLSLKSAIREVLGRELEGDPAIDDLFALETRIDALALQAFDIYVKCREQVYQLKANELRNRTVRLLERSNSVADRSDALDDQAL